MSYLECLICTHAMGWHRQKLGACLECGCGAFQFQPHETLAEIERMQASLERIRIDARAGLGMGGKRAPVYRHFHSLAQEQRICGDDFSKSEDLQNEAALDRGDE